MTTLDRSLPDSRAQLHKLARLTRRTLRYWWLIALLAVMGGGLGFGASVLAGRKYTSETVIIHRELIPGRLLQGDDAVSSSRNLEARFADLAHSSRILAGLIHDHGLLRDLVAARGMTAAIEEMRQRVRVRGRGGTIHLSFAGESPAQAQKVIAELALILIDEELELKAQTVAATRSFLDRERASATAKLQEREQALAAFLAKHPEFADDTAAGAPGAAIRGRDKRPKSDPTPADPGLIALRRRHRRLLAELAEAGAEPAQTPASIARLRGSLGETRARLAARRELRATLLAKFTGQHPDVRAVDREIRRLKRQLAREHRALAKVESAATSAGDQRTKRLRAELRTVEREIAGYERTLQRPRAPEVQDDAVIELETEWSRLRRQVDESRELTEAIEARTFLSELFAASEVGSGGARIEILDPASLPYRPTGMSRRLMAMAGFSIFAAIALAFSALLAILDDRIIDVDDLEYHHITGPAATIPSR